ncbi:MAG: hypothetical protein R3321_00175 [Nitrososphaeraceae archaeon]|nr:hypothetical protein [Nitrososphaeraceae archaeon]
MSTQSARVVKAKGKYKISKRGRRQRKFKPLTKEESKLVQDNLDLAEYPVYSALVNINYNSGSLTKRDLTQIAFFAMCVAAKDYNEKSGNSYRTYAQSKIQGYIMHALRDKSRMATINRKTMTYRIQVRELLNEGLSFNEVAKKLDINIRDVYLCDISWQESHASFDYVHEKGLSLEPIHIDAETMYCEIIKFRKLNDLTEDELEKLLDFYDI